MSRKTYTEHYKHDTVLSYELTICFTINGIASDLAGIHCALDLLLSAQVRRPIPTETKSPARWWQPTLIKVWLEGSAMPSAPVCWNVKMLNRGKSEKSPARLAKYFHGRDELVNRFRFADDNQGLHKVKRVMRGLEDQPVLVLQVEISRSCPQVMACCGCDTWG